jgi:glycosyltransferase involved in cell wall biosynthesis
VVISPSQFLLDFYTVRGLFVQSLKILVRNPLTLDFESQKSKVKSQKDGTKFNFLYLGQVEEHKGVFLLVEAFRGIKNARLHVVGDGSKLGELRDGTQISGTTKIDQDGEHIVFHGRVDRDKLPELFSQVDVTVVPSLCYENSPTVIFESLYFDVPVLASRIEGIAELIEEGKNGFTFEAGSVDSLKEKMKWCVGNVREIKKMEIKTPMETRSEGEYIERLTGLYSS